MKAVSWLRVAIYCAAVVVAHSVLLLVVQRTGVVEKLMAGTFSRGELLLIVAFIACRLLTYLVVPATLAGFTAAWLVKRARPRMGAV